MVVENAGMKREVKVREAEIKEMVEVVEKHREEVKEKEREVEEVKYKWEVAEKLRGQMKEHF